MSSKFLPDDYSIPEIECPITKMYEENEKGSHGHFVRVGITMAPDMIKYLKHALADLKPLGYPNCDLSSLIREACKEHLIKITDYINDKASEKRIDILNKQAQALEDSIHEEQHSKYLESINS